MNQSSNRRTINRSTLENNKQNIFAYKFDEAIVDANFKYFPYLQILMKLLTLLIQT